MKTKTSISSLLGVTQEQAALLFGVSRSLWSLVEIGKRNLPLHATELLGKILVKIQESEATSNSPVARQHDTFNKKLEKLLHENTYQILHLEREIAAAIKKREKESRLRRLKDLLTNLENEKKFQTGMASIINSKVSRTNDVVISNLLFEQEHRMELLQFEKSLLESKLQSLKLKMIMPKAENNPAL
ncbi:hypothetical protein FNO01nite_29680 [Flavobacterium noncentrifugens]|nr:helix-turn-helix transcriptional regulator [Flavobacterium noncentrifugens]GEP52296.1 hypothetical protein FNO01nite_29680 [Flavobacterium noncentrifugens]